MEHQFMSKDNLVPTEIWRKKNMTTQFGTRVLTEIWKIMNWTTHLVPGTNWNLGKN